MPSLALALPHPGSDPRWSSRKLSYSYLSESRGRSGTYSELRMFSSKGEWLAIFEDSCPAPIVSERANVLQANLSFLILSVYALVLTCDSNGATSAEWRMKEMTANDDFERFRTGAAKYAAYLETPEGRLRSDLAFANLQDFIPLQDKPSLCALDLGCGTGATAVRLARLGIQVTLLDSSPAMLDIATRAAREAEVPDKVVLQHGDATQLANLFHARSFDVILCHNLLEYCDDPVAVLRGAARALRDPSGILSVLVRNQAGEVLKAAIQDGDLAVTEDNLTAEWGHESLYRGRVRLFTARSLQAMLLESSLAVTAERGVRVVSDYLHPRVSRTDEYDRILELERKLGRRPEFAAVARYTHCLAQRASPIMKDVA
jgi:S-adenosylmethionine-dependent methyltransferase